MLGHRAVLATFLPCSTMWHLYSDTYILCVGEAGDPPGTAHKHHAIQLAIGLQDDFSAVVEGVVPQFDTRAVLVAPDRMHLLTGHAAMLLCEPESEMGRRFLGCLAGADHLELRNHLELTQSHLPGLSTLRAECQRVAADPSDMGARLAVLACMFECIGELTRGAAPAPALDARLQRVIAQMFDAEGRRRPLSALARIAGISPGRLRHLFVREVGIPLRQFAVWKRSLNALRALRDEQALTAVAHQAGFADQAAYSRAHRQLFGRTPSVFRAEKNLEVSDTDLG